MSCFSVSCEVTHYLIFCGLGSDPMKFSLHYRSYLWIGGLRGVAPICVCAHFATSHVIGGKESDWVLFQKPSLDLDTSFAMPNSLWK